MTIEDAINAINTECECVKRQIPCMCDRDCSKCDLALDDEDVITAYDMAIAALRAQQDEQEQSVMQGMEQCGYVNVSKEFAKRLKPYKGCPRGAEGIPGGDCREPKSAYLLRWLKRFENNKLEGPDDHFICVTDFAFNACIDFLGNIAHQEPEKNDPLTLEELEDVASLTCQFGQLQRVPSGDRLDGHLQGQEGRCRKIFAAPSFGMRHMGWSG